MKMSNESLPTGPDKKAREQQVEAALHAKLDAIAKRHEENVLGSIGEMIARHETADRSDIPDVVNRSGERVSRLQSPTSRLYRSMPRDEREYRSPDSDHWCQQWLSGVMQNDGATQALAKARLDEIFPQFARADTLEGAADAAGGFAAGTGGVLMPRVLEELVAINRDRVAKMARFATTYQMTAQEHNIPTGAAMTAFMVGEATSGLTQGEPAFAQVPLVAHRAIAKAIMGNDLLEDAAVNVVNFVTRRGGAILGVLEDTEFFDAGTGSAPHVTKLSGTTFDEETDGVMSYNDVLTMYQALPQVYRATARWFLASDVISLLAQVRDGLDRPFYQSLMDPPMIMDDSPEGGPMPGAQGTLLGKPVHEVPLTSGDIWFGDPSAAYAIGRRSGIRVDVSREFLFDTFRTIFLIHQRIAGNNIDTGAAQYATNVSSATTL
jgi:HK97 family phage major capsid protein